jgi:hypothetical protein
VKQPITQLQHFSGDRFGHPNCAQVRATRNWRSIMKKLVLASASAIALLGLAACSDTDETTTQSTQPPVEQVQPAQPGAPAEPMATPPADETPGNGTSADEIRPVE